MIIDFLCKCFVTSYFILDKHKYNNTYSFKLFYVLFDGYFIRRTHVGAVEIEGMAFD